MAQLLQLWKIWVLCIYGRVMYKKNPHKDFSVMFRFAEPSLSHLVTNYSLTLVKLSNVYKLSNVHKPIFLRSLSWYYFIRAYRNYIRTVLSLRDFCEFPFWILNFKQILWLYAKGLNGLLILKVLLWHHCTTPFFYVCFVKTQRSSIYEKPVLNL